MSRNPDDLGLPSPDANDGAAAYLLRRQQLADQNAADEMTAAANGAQAELAPKRDAAPAAPPGSTAGRVAKDVGKGAVEAIPAAAKGVHDAFANLFNMGDELAGWLEEKAADTPFEYATGGIKISGDGIEFLSAKKVREMRAKGEMTQTSSLLPDIGKEPSTVTGGLVKGVAQFVTGMLGASRMFAGGGAIGTAARGAASSFTAFEPQQQRLANLIEKFPALSNPVTRYLQAKPDDNAAEGRLKNAVEGAGLGVLADGFVHSVRILRTAALAKPLGGAAADVRAGVDNSVPPVTAEQLAAPRELPADAFSALGSEADNAPLVKLQASPATLADVQGTKADVPRETFINFARIDAPEDVKRVMQRLSDLGSVGSDSARAGTRGFEAVKLDAAHQDAWQTLLDRRPGQPLGDAEGLAARQLWAATTDKVAELAETAATNPSEANLFAFRKMLDVHDMVQREVLGARASTARALSAWRIPAGGGAERLRNVAAALDASGGSQVSRELAARVTALAKAGMVKEMGAVAEKGAAATTRDAVLEAWVNGLLSNPATHAANTISNLTVLPMRMAERATAAKIGQLLGDEGGVAAGEAAAQWAGAVQGFRDIFRYYGKAARALLPSDSMLPEVAGANPPPLAQLNVPSLTKLEHPPSITSDAFRLSSETGLGRAVDLLGSAVRTPGKVLNASDEFFKVVGYRMELNAQAVRQATAEVNAGKLTADGFKARVADIVAHPPENVRLAAADAALYQTFNNAPGKLGKALGKLTTDYPALKVILPFTRTPSNILNFTFERTPLAPLMSKFRADVAAGGPRRDLALAQMALGSAAMLTAVDLTMSGQISGRGPVDKGIKEAMAREGWQPYSVKLGNRWYSYNRLDPSGSLLGMAADATELLMQAQHDALDDQDTEKLAAATALAFAGNVTNKTYLSGLSSVIEALNDPQRAAEGWLQRTAGSVVLAGVAGIERIQDPTVREVYSMMDSIRSRTPGLSDSLPPRLDLWGQPVKTESGLGKPFDLMSPVYSKEPSAQPIDKEIERLGANITMPGRKTSFNGVTVGLSAYPKAYSRYVELAGNALKHDKYGAPVTVGGLGARDYLNAIVTGTSPISVIYKLRSDGPDGGKDAFIRDAISKYREKARDVLLDEFPKLKAEVDEKKRQLKAMKMPVLDAAR